MSTRPYPDCVSSNNTLSPCHPVPSLPPHLNTSTSYCLISLSPRNHLTTLPSPPCHLITSSPPWYLITLSPSHPTISSSPCPRLILVLALSLSLPCPCLVLILTSSPSSSSPRLISYLRISLSIPFLGHSILLSLVPVLQISILILVYHLYSSFHLRPRSRPLVSPFVLVSMCSLSWT